MEVDESTIPPKYARKMRMLRSSEENTSSSQFLLSEISPMHVDAPPSPVSPKHKPKGKGKTKGLKSRASVLGSFLGSLRRRKEGLKSIPAEHVPLVAAKRSASEPPNENDAQDLFRSKLPADEEADDEASTSDPFKTPPRTPTAPGPPLSPLMNSPDSISESARRRKIKRTRLMSRMKSVQILGAEASEAVARKWRLDGWDST